MSCIVYLGHHRGGHCHRTGHRTTVDTLYVVITAQVPLHMHVTSEHKVRVIKNRNILLTVVVTVLLHKKDVFSQGLFPGATEPDVIY